MVVSCLILWDADLAWSVFSSQEFRSLGWPYAYWWLEIIMHLLNMMNHTCVSFWYLAVGLKNVVFLFCFIVVFIDLRGNLKIHELYCGKTHQTDFPNSLYRVSESYFKSQSRFDTRKVHQILGPHNLWLASASIPENFLLHWRHDNFTESIVYIVTSHGNNFD